MPNKSPSNAPKSVKGPSAGRQRDAGWRGWVEYDLSAAERAALKAAPFTDEDFASRLLDTVTAGISCKFSYDDYNRCYQCVLMRSDKYHADAQIGLSGRGSSPQKAFKYALWVHYEVVDEDWSGWLASKDKPVRDWDD